MLATVFCELSRPPFMASSFHERSKLLGLDSRRLLATSHALVAKSQEVLRRFKGIQESAVVAEVPHSEPEKKESLQAAYFVYLADIMLRGN